MELGANSSNHSHCASGICFRNDGLTFAATACFARVMPSKAFARQLKTAFSSNGGNSKSGLATQIQLSRRICCLILLSNDLGLNQSCKHALAKASPAAFGSTLDSCSRFTSKSRKRLILNASILFGPGSNLHSKLVVISSGKSSSTHFSSMAEARFSSVLLRFPRADISLISVAINNWDFCTTLSRASEPDRSFDSLQFSVPVSQRMQI